MTTEHSITPTPKLVAQWLTEVADLKLLTPTSLDYLATQAARWGADQELKACCEYIQHEVFHGFATDLRAARRPKPPSLAEQALAKTEAILNDPGRVLLTEEREALELNRRALERLQELEQQENNDN